MSRFFLLPPGRNFGLDAIRAFSIFLVLIQHFGINIPGLGPMKIGTIGVEIFFVLSGFLIGGILLREIEKKEPLIPTLRKFWYRRWLRILPLYYLVLLFKFVVLDHSIGWNILYYVFFLQNNFYGISFLPVSWSLVIEEWFYLFVPFFLFILYRKFEGNGARLAGILFFLLVVNLLRILYVHLTDAPYAGINSNFVLRMDSLFIGVMMAFLKKYIPEFYRKLESFPVFIASLLLTCGYIIWYWSHSRNGEGIIDQMWLPRTLGFLLLPLFIGFAIPWCATFKTWENAPLPGRIAGFFISWTSVLTYGIYLIHPFIASSLRDLAHTGGNQIFMFFIFLLLTYISAFLVYHFFEHPILKYRDRQSKGMTPGKPEVG